jgi:hypothetical protein
MKNLGLPIFWPRFEPGASQIRGGSVIQSTATFDIWKEWVKFCGNGYEGSETICSSRSLSTFERNLVHPFDQGRKGNQESCLLFASFVFSLTLLPRSSRQCYCTKRLNTYIQLYGVTSQQKKVFFTFLILFDEPHGKRTLKERRHGWKARRMLISKWIL